jgi:pyruvate formate lyase activating enzyme
MSTNLFPGATPTRFWHALDDGRVQCDVCPRFCKMHDGQRGFCFVRAAQDGAVVLTTYGRSSGFAVDPIEKKPLNHFLPGTTVFSFGTAGCNLGCRYCQNWDISKSRDVETLSAAASPKEIALEARRLGCRSVAFTYNDPTVFLEYAADTAKECHALGLKTVSVTAGYICPEPRAELYQHIDAANVDLKSFREEFYEKVTGAHLANVLETLLYLKKETNVWLEITTLLIPGYNDGDDEIEDLTAWVASSLGTRVPLHFTAFHPDWKMRHVPPTPLAALRRARAIALKNGIKYVYTGNLPDADGTSTRCPVCNELLVGRRGYRVTSWRLVHGRCPVCAEACPGVFEEAPGEGEGVPFGVRFAASAAHAPAP